MEKDELSKMFAEQLDQEGSLYFIYLIEQNCTNLETPLSLLLY